MPMYAAAYSVVRRRNPLLRFHDWNDWLRGYPFEVASPDELTEFFEARGFELERLVANSGYGCNQLTFRRL